MLDIHKQVIGNFTHDGYQYHIGLTPYNTSGFIKRKLGNPDDKADDCGALMRWYEVVAYFSTFLTEAELSEVEALVPKEWQDPVEVQVLKEFAPSFPDLSVVTMSFDFSRHLLRIENHRGDFMYLPYSDLEFIDRREDFRC